MRPGLAALLCIITVATPARAHPGAGIVVDRQGNVYFVMPGRNTVMRLAPNGRASVYVNDSRLRLPHHLVLGADGSLYVASDHDGIVWRVKPDGSLAEHFASNRAPRVSYSQELFVGAGGDPFTVDSAGNVFAPATATGSDIVRVTQQGVVQRYGAKASPRGLHFSAMAWGPGGELYVTDLDRVWRITRDSAEAFATDAGLERAVGVAVDRHGNVLVADHLGGRVVRIGADGKVNTPPALAGLEVSRPTGVAVAGADTWVLDTPPWSVSVWRVRGNDAERLFVQRERGAYTRWVVPAVPALLLLLLVLRMRERRRMAKSPAQR